MASVPLHMASCFSFSRARASNGSCSLTLVERTTSSGQVPVRPWLDLEAKASEGDQEMKSDKVQLLVDKY
jgi:hypothetical protein